MKVWAKSQNSAKKLEQIQAQGIYLQKETNLASNYVCLTFLPVSSSFLKIYQHFVGIL